jgi:hypothetical protein
MNKERLPPRSTPEASTQASWARTVNLGYAAVAGQAGCVTMAVIIISLLVGLWLDAQMGTRGPFTIGLLLFSIPFSLFLMVRIALEATARITPPRRKDEQDHTQEG